MEIGLLKNEYRPLQKAIKGLGPDGNQVNPGKIQKSKQPMNQSVEDRFQSQGHRADQEGHGIEDSHPLKGKDRGDQERNEDVVFELEI